jgi:hypothetical protein
MAWSVIVKIVDFTLNAIIAGRNAQRAVERRNGIPRFTVTLKPLVFDAVILPERFSPKTCIVIQFAGASNGSASDAGK